MEQEQINKGETKKGLNIVHLNARSVLNNIDDIRQNLGSFDIVSITETWLDESGGTLNYNISDHLSIFLIKKKIRNKSVKTHVSGRSYMRYRKEAFIEALGGMDWDRYENIEDPNLLWEMFLGNITSVLDQTCPIRVLNVVNSTPKWLTNTLLRKNEGQGQSL